MHSDSMMAGRMSAGLLNGCRRRVLADQLGRQVLAGLGGQYAVGDPRRQNVRPLIDRLVCDADCMGSGGNGSAQQFNGFGFFHAGIEPQFSADAQPQLSGCGCTLRNNG